MERWSLDIIRQEGFDWWIWVCIVASLLLGFYAISRRLWNQNHGWTSTVCIFAAVGGTVGVACFPALHAPIIGLFWTLGILGILTAIFYLNLRPYVGGRRTWILLLLRTAAVTMLVAMLFEPVLRYESGAAPRRPMIVLVDASGSMSFSDIAGGPTRIQSAWQALRSQMAHIEEHFVPQFFTFSSDVQPLKEPEDLDSMTADGKATDIVGAVRGAAAASPDPDTPVLVISDGQDNVSSDVVAGVREFGRRVSTLTAGSDQAESSAIAGVAIDSVDCGEDLLVGHGNPVVATIKSSALADRLVQVKFSEIDDSGKSIGEVQIKPLVLQSSAVGQKVGFNFRPNVSGIHRLAVWIDPIPGERTVVNNRQEVQTLAVDPRIKVLYIEGRLRPEYTYLHRLLERDPNLESSTLLRLRENQFTSGEQGGQAVEQLPATLDDWKHFDVVILGDLDASYLNSSCQASLEQAISGGIGFIMIGGESNFAAGDYGGSLIEKALPVWMDPGAAVADKTDFVPQITRDGEAHPILDGLRDCFVGPDGQTTDQAVTPLRGAIAVGGAKTGAQVLLVRPGGGGQIVLAVQRYGAGRSAAFTADTTYLWKLADPRQSPDAVYDRFWGQLIRWLAGSDVRNRPSGPGVVGMLDKSVYQYGQTVRIRALVRADRGIAAESAQVMVSERLASNESSSRQLTLSPSPDRVGIYQVTFPDPSQDLKSLPAGDYVLELTAQKDGQALGEQQLKFTVAPPADEMLKLAANPQLMTQIAEATGGYSGPLDDLPSVVDEMIRADPATQGGGQRSLALDNFARVGAVVIGSRHDWAEKFDLPMQAAMVFVLLSAEWILRRRWELQ
ncbi:MAG: hypothetical protein ABSF29_09020 [Tepidisphaeraceae bacterium]|jgi:uncharacterized membrane protein